MPRIIFDDVQSGACKVFDRPIEIIRVDRPDAVDAALLRMQERLDAGFYLAGYFSYELGYLLERRLVHRLPPDRGVPLLWFGVFGNPPTEQQAAALEAEWRDCRAYVSPIAFEWDESTYRRKFECVHEHIANGDLYQANLSMRGRFTVVGDPRGLYRAVRRAGGAAYGAYIDDGERQILSFSPELFFAVDTSGTITCKPMKGTAARVPDDDRADRAARAWLQASAKNRAENIMIVDLVRNDLGRVADTGSVKVSGLLDVESYPTVHQMVSTVSATLKPDASVRTLLGAVFPCGSVTGAPKIRAMEVIRDLETSARGVYCGAIGWFAPDHSACFNVAIRTLTIAQGRGELGVGGGLVSGSRAGDEYAECRLKARYFDAACRPLKLIETLRHDGEYTRLALHLKRLATSARAFRFPFDDARVRAALGRLDNDARPLRVRLTLDAQGRIEVQCAPLGPAATWRFVISGRAVNSHDALLRHKTSWREDHDAEREQATREFGCDEVMLCNERGELCEGSRSNIFVRIDGELLTPAADCGLLDGCLRQELLGSGQCREAVLYPVDLDRADQVYFGNSLRGLISAVCVQKMAAIA